MLQLNLVFVLFAIHSKRVQNAAVTPWGARWSPWPASLWSPQGVRCWEGWEEKGCMWWRLQLSIVDSLVVISRVKPSGINKITHWSSGVCLWSRVVRSWKGNKVVLFYMCRHAQNLLTSTSWVLTSTVIESWCRNIGCHVGCFSHEILKNILILLIIFFAITFGWTDCAHRELLR